MQVDVVLGLFELRISIELRLRLAPIKPVAPIGDELAHVVDAGPVSPGLTRRLIGPPGARQPLPYIFEAILRHAKAKWFWCCRIPGRPVRLRMWHVCLCLAKPFRIRL